MCDEFSGQVSHDYSWGWSEGEKRVLLSLPCWLALSMYKHSMKSGGTPCILRKPEEEDFVQDEMWKLKIGGRFVH